MRIAPCDRNGKTIGGWVEGEANVLDGAERDRILKVFKKEYGSIGYSMVSLVGRFRGERQMTAVISIKLKPLTLDTGQTTGSH